MVDFKSITTGNAQPLVTSTRLKEIEVSLPDIEEQRRISQVFDSFDNMIERNKDLIDIVNEEREYTREVAWTVLKSLGSRL